MNLTRCLLLWKAGRTWRVGVVITEDCPDSDAGRARLA
jgi:hypothetical protein